MIIVRITGGLGNQMFQYAFSKKLEKELSKTVKYDLRFYGNQLSDSIDQRFLTLENAFEIVLPQATETELNTIVPKTLFGKIKKKFKQFILGKKLKYLKENATLNQNYNLYVETLYLDGNWQSKSKLEGLNVHNLFPFKPLQKKINEFLNDFNDKELISIHVRRGDYQNLKLYKLIEDKYYSEAISILKKVNTHFLIFSDDSEFLESWGLLKNLNYTIVSGKEFKDFEELYLMSRCNHQIIANSTFSWWAAMLNQNENKKVICPKNCYNDSNLEENLSNLIPEEWIKL